MKLLVLCFIVSVFIDLGHCQIDVNTIRFFPYSGSVDLYTDFEIGQHIIEYDELHVLGSDFPDDYWSIYSGSETGMIVQQPYAVYSRWHSVGTGLHVPLISYRGLSAGLASGFGYGNYRHYEVTSVDTRVKQWYKETTHPMYKVQFVGFIDYRFSDDAYVSFRGGVKNIKMYQHYTLPSLELALRYLYFEIGASANFYKKIVYRTYSTGQTEQARTENILGSIYIRAVFPISDDGVDKIDLPTVIPSIR